MSRFLPWTSPGVPRGIIMTGEYQGEAKRPPFFLKFVVCFCELTPRQILDQYYMARPLSRLTVIHPGRSDETPDNRVNRCRAFSQRRDRRQ